MNLVSQKRNILHSREASLIDKIRVLSRRRAMRAIDTHFINLFRLLGNMTVHDSAAESSEFVLDKELAFCLLKLFERVLRAFSAIS